MTEHTKGPWKFEHIGNELVLFGDHGDCPFILRAPLGNLTLDHPDARLIEAAPELLEACKAALSFGEHDKHCTWLVGGPCECRLNETRKRIEDAIAKATGVKTNSKGTTCRQTNDESA